MEKEKNIMKKLKFEGEYLNGARNGKGKEYDKEGNLKFEGEYSYGEKIKGKEYVEGKLEYDGDFLFGKTYNGNWYDKNGNIISELKNWNGKTREYYENGELKFEGEYLNGKRNGKGEEYDKYGHLIFEGEYLYGKRNGKGKEYYSEYMIFFFIYFMKVNI